MASSHNPDCTVLVCSCDKYADLLPPFAALWRKFWPDCPFETVLVTESDPAAVNTQRPTRNPQPVFDRIVACGAGGSWCSRLVKALEQITTPYVLMLCDDYLLTAPVDTAHLLARLAQAKAADAGNLRLIPNPKPTAANSAPAGGTDLFRYRPATAYAIATQAGFWRRDFLARLADGKASIWEFERYGSFDPQAAAMPLLVTPTKEFPFCDAVHKGFWERSGVKLLADNAVPYDYAVRGLPPCAVRLREAAKALVFAIFPASLIVRVQNALDCGMKERR